MRLRAIIRLATFIAIIVGIVSHMTINTDAAQAATYYVATTGSNSNTCAQAQSITTPKQGLSSATACLTAGDILLIRAGTYTGSTQTGNIPSGTSWNSPVTIRAYPGETVTFVPQAANHTLYFNNGNHYIVIDGIVIDGTGGLDGIKVTDNGSPGSGSHHIRFINVEVKNSPAQGVLVNGSLNGATDVEFINCHIHHNGTSSQFDHGMYLSVDNILVDGCDIHDNAGYGIQKYDNGINSIIRNTKAYNHASKSGIAIISNGGHKVYNNLVWNNVNGISVLYGATGDVYNNTAHANGNGFEIFNPSTNLTIDNNIAYANSANGIWLGGSSNDIQIRNNLLSGNGSANYLDLSGGRGILSNNRIGNQYNPSFVNAGGHDYHLQGSSAAIDAGRTISSLTTDNAEVIRPQGTAYDIGAFEFQAGQLGAPSNVKAVSQ